MKVLIPVDFSIFTDYALNLAWKLALKKEIEILLFHAHEGDDNAYTKLELIKSKCKTKNIACTIMISDKTLVDGLVEYLENDSVDLILMGSHGASGKQEWFLGSNAQKVIRRIHQDNIIIKEAIDTLQFENLLFASSFTEKDKEAFKKLLTYLPLFETKHLHLLSVNTQSFFTQPGIIMKEALEDFKDIITDKDLKVTTHFEADYSVEAGVRHFAEDNKIDLISIANNEGHPIKRLFQGSNVEMLVNHSDQPVLCIS